MTSQRVALRALLAVAVACAACSQATPASPAPTSVVGATHTARPEAGAGATSGSDPAPAAASPAGAPAPSPSAAPASAALAPACTAPATPTPPQTEGPYFTAGSPEKATLVEAGMEGKRLVLTGFVVTTDCRPVANAVVDIWQADAAGAYDTAGYRLRGHVRTTATGAFTIETIMPGEYPGRTEHIHVKVTPPGGTTLTTQLYLPDSPANRQDGIFDPHLVVDLAADGAARAARFTFVLDT